MGGVPFVVASSWLPCPHRPRAAKLSRLCHQGNESSLISTSNPFASYCSVRWLPMIILLLLTVRAPALGTLDQVYLRTFLLPRASTVLKTFPLRRTLRLRTRFSREYSAASDKTRTPLNLAAGTMTRCLQFARGYSYYLGTTIPSEERSVAGGLLAAAAVGVVKPEHAMLGFDVRVGSGKDFEPLS